MITYQLPRRIRYIPANAIFSATFNAPAIGKYDFNKQRVVFVEKLLPNSVYLIDAFSVAGNVSSEDYLSSIDSIPTLDIQKTLNDENIFDNKIQIGNFSTDRQIVHFFKTGLSNCGLAGTLTGVLNQIADFVGIATISLSINLSLHVVDESDFEKQFSRQA